MTSTVWVNVRLVYLDPAKFGDVGPQVSPLPPTAPGTRLLEPEQDSMGELTPASSNRRLDEELLNPAGCNEMNGGLLSGGRRWLLPSLAGGHRGIVLPAKPGSLEIPVISSCPLPVVHIYIYTYTHMPIYLACFEQHALLCG